MGEDEKSTSNNKSGKLKIKYYADGIPTKKKKN